MKKFISMVMAAAMVVSLVPATAFAASGDVVAKSVKVVDAVTDLVEDGNVTLVANAPIVSFKIDDAEAAGATIKQEVKIKLDGAKFWSDAADCVVEDADKTANGGNDNGKCIDEVATELEGLWSQLGSVVPTLTKISNTSATFELEGTEAQWQALVTGDDAVEFALQTKLNKDNSGSEAKVTVTSDIEGLEITDKVFAAVEGKGIEVELEDDVVDVAEEEIVTLEDIEIKPAVGSDFGDVLDVNDTIKIKVSKGFEFKNVASIVHNWTMPSGESDPAWTFELGDDDDEIILKVGTQSKKALELTLEGIQIEAVDAKAGDVATLTIKATDCDAVKVEVAKVVDLGLTISVDEDEDVPVFYSGVGVGNYGLTVDDDHKALEVTVEESVVGSFENKDVLEFVLPEGVFVTDVTKGDDDFGMFDIVSGTDTEFMAAYKKGDHEGFEFARRTLNESVAPADPMVTEFTMEVIAVPGFVGDVELTMLVDGEEVGSVVIAKFEAPFTIEAQQNDLKIDYRNTVVPTDVVVKEAEAGLWAKDKFNLDFSVDHMTFEDDAVFTVNEDESDMEIDSDEMKFTVDVESDEEAAVVTISGIELYMDRNLPAGAYDLEVSNTGAYKFYTAATNALYTTKVGADGTNYFVADYKDFDYNKTTGKFDVPTAVVKEGWINIVTAGREQDDASFTTKVVVPVGESYIIAGENTVALDVPAYVSAAGYTMLPVRAVATALGINNNNVLWDQATKTVTILYGQRIITMTVGAKVINVNGSAIPASASVEVVNGRTFLPMRDLATALGVTDITWDAATKTATLNGNI